jgi:hypothetical protein
MVLQTLETMGAQHGYDLTAAGRRQLEKEKQAWDQMAGIIQTVLHGKA